MSVESIKKIICKFIDRHPIGVLATTTAGRKPEAAVITIITNDKLEIVFETFKNYRKYKNLKKNQNAALVVWDEKVTVQYEGVAKELIGLRLQKQKERYFEKYPKLKKWDGLPKMAWFEISPKWIRYLDNNTNPRTIHEVSF